MADLERVSISIEKSLSKKLDKLVRAQKARNRSDFIRSLVRAKLVDTEWIAGNDVIGTIMLIFDHHRRQISQKLTGLQHHSHVTVLATTHIHLDHRLCAEMIMVRGSGAEIEEMTRKFRGQKGVLHVSLAASSTGQHL